jgi:hypothetical protein
MLYIALALIACGILLILLAVFSTGKNRHGLDAPARGAALRELYTPSRDSDGFMEGPLVDLDETFFIESETPEGRERGGADRPDNENAVPGTHETDLLRSQGILSELESSIEDINVGDAAPARMAYNGEDSGDYAVLYEDASGVVNYAGGDNTIDPTLNEYKKMKRIGRGRIEVVKEGINFYIGRKLFRYDFFKVDRLKLGDNFIALQLRGSSVVRLILFEKTDFFNKGVRKDIEELMHGKR